MRRWKACRDCRYDGDCDEQKHPTHPGFSARRFRNIKRGGCPCNGWERDENVPSDLDDEYDEEEMKLYWDGQKRKYPEVDDS